jgi:5'-nucleotidase
LPSAILCYHKAAGSANRLFAVILAAVINYKGKAGGFPMRILVTNDDGILSEGLWILVRALKNIAEVTVVAPDREQSATGTAVTLRQPLRVQSVRPPVPEVETYSVEGRPSDSVILALGKLVKGRVDMVVAGINPGSNLGEDAHISGTVGAAMQGYLHGLPSLAVSAPNGNERCLETAAGVAAALIKKMAANHLAAKIFLNVNVPDLPAAEITGAKITRLARESHLNTVEESNHGQDKCYRLLRQEINGTNDNGSDIQAIKQGQVSITPLYFHHADKPPYPALHRLCADLFRELRGQINPV